MNFAAQKDQRVKIKESKKRDKYLDFARELRKLWDMRVMIPIVVGALVVKCLEKRLKEQEIGRRIKTISDDLLKLEYLEESWIPKEICGDSVSSKRPPTNIRVKGSKIIIIIIIND